MTINVGDARDKLSLLIQKVIDGETVTICRHGEPVVDLVRTDRTQHANRRFGTMKGRIILKDKDWKRGPETNEELAAWLKGEFE